MPRQPVVTSTSVSENNPNSTHHQHIMSSTHRQISRMTRKTGPDGRREAPASFAQQRLWFLAQLAPDSRQYHMFQATPLSGDLVAPLWNGR